MNLSTFLSALAAFTSSCIAASHPKDNSRHLSDETPLLFTNPPPNTVHDRRIPTSYESAVLGRRILALSPLGTLSTVFPDGTGAGTNENRPSGLSGVPIGLMDYIADCEEAGNPTILAIKIATSFKNVAAGSNISVSINWVPPYPPAKRIESNTHWAHTYLPNFLAKHFSSASADYDPVPYSAANLPRFSLLGYLEPISVLSGSDELAETLKTCFVSAHPDAKYWLPGNRIHASEWVRLVVTQVYWIGGFGDRAYIGWIPVEEWKNVTRDEWEGVRLPGEKKGWKEWSIGSWGWTSEFDL